MYISKIENNHSLSIVHINTHDQAGGAAKSAWRLTDIQRSLGHQAKMLVGFKKSSAPYSFSFPIEPDLSIQKICQTNGQLFYEFQGSHKLIDYPLVTSADLLHFHNMHGWYFNPFSISVLSHYKPVVWTLRDMQSITGHCAHSFDCERWQIGCGDCPGLDIEPAIEVDTSSQMWKDKKLIYDHSHLWLVTPSQWLKKNIEKSILKDHPVELIYNAVDTDIFRPHDKTEVRKKFGIPEDYFAIGAVAHGGTLKNQWKGGEYTQAALERLWAKYPKFIFVNIGEQKKSNDPRIINIPHIKDEDVLAQAYSALDIFLYTSLADTCPLVVIEALSCGVPIVTFNTGGIPELVRDKVDGFIATYKNINEIVQFVELLFADKKLRDRFSHNARKNAVDQFDQTIMHQKYMNLYSRSIKEHLTQSKKIKIFPLSKVPAIIKTPAFLKAETAKTNHQNRTGASNNNVPSDKNNSYKNPRSFATKYCISADNFYLFNYSKNSHFEYFKNYDLALINKKANPNDCDLKVYQDLLVYTFILETIPKGSKILEVGGGDSRVLKAIKNDYECWNIDKLEGRGNGLTSVDASGYRLVKSYMGEFSEELPENYFDFVFSISVLEHAGDKEKTYQKICLDIDRVLKTDGYSLHCFDILIKTDEVWTNNLLLYMFQNYKTINAFIPLEEIRYDNDLFCMSKKAYVKGWEIITKEPYEKFGKPVSYNILWRKTETKDLHYKKIVSEKLKNNLIINVTSKAPKITIVTPSYNQSEFLKDCIDSILSQKYPNLEYIIMDGGSNDGSVEIIKKYENHLAYWQSMPDSGQYDAINQGFKMSTGSIMAWLNSDDKYHGESLFKAAYIFQEFPFIEWITGRPTAWNEKGDLVRVFENLPLWDREKYLKKIFKKICIQQESTFWRKTLWQKAGGSLRTELQLAGDLELWVRFFRYARLFTVDTLLGGYRFQPNQKTNVSMEKYIEEGNQIVDQEISDICNGQFPLMLNAPQPLLFDESEFTNYKKSIISKEKTSNISDNQTEIDSIYILANSNYTATIATSISPHDIHNQQQAIQSWLNIGFKVVSMNCSEEIKFVKKYFPGVGFITTTRDAREVLVKPLIYIDDILDYLKNTDTEICGIINSDIFLTQNAGFLKFIQKEAAGSLVYGSRVEVESFETLQGDVYERGFDAFFFPKSAFSYFPPSEFCIGATWWDYWVPLVLSLEKYPIKKINFPFAFHKIHPYNWNREQFVLLGKKVLEFLSDSLGKADNTKSSHNPWISFNTEFLRFMHAHFSENDFPPNEKAVILFRYLQCFSNYVLKFLKFNSVELLYP